MSIEIVKLSSISALPFFRGLILRFFKVESNEVTAYLGVSAGPRGSSEVKVKVAKMSRKTDGRNGVRMPREIACLVTRHLSAQKQQPLFCRFQHGLEASSAGSLRAFRLSGKVKFIDNQKFTRAPAPISLDVER